MHLCVIIIIVLFALIFLNNNYVKKDLKTLNVFKKKPANSLVLNAFKHENNLINHEISTYHIGNSKIKKKQTLNELKNVHVHRSNVKAGMK